jgi:hypothetical protein
MLADIRMMQKKYRACRSHCSGCQPLRKTRETNADTD